MSGINVVEASGQAKSRVNGYLDLALTAENVGKVVETWGDCAGGDAGQGKLYGESLMNYVLGTLEFQRGETRFTRCSRDPHCTGCIVEFTSV